MDTSQNPSSFGVTPVNNISPLASPSYQMPVNHSNQPNLIRGIIPKVRTNTHTSGQRSTKSFRGFHNAPSLLKRPPSSATPTNVFKEVLMETLMRRRWGGHLAAGGNVSELQEGVFSVRKQLIGWTWLDPVP